MKRKKNQNFTQINNNVDYVTILFQLKLIYLNIYMNKLIQKIV